MTTSLLLNVTYQDETGKFWRDSYLKNKVVALEDGVHATIAKAIRDTDGLELSYKGKPQGNVYIDKKDGETKRVGYLYRAMDSIFCDDVRKYKKAFFTVWVSVKEVREYPIDDIDGI